MSDLAKKFWSDYFSSEKYNHKWLVNLRSSLSKVEVDLDGLSSFRVLLPPVKSRLNFSEKNRKSYTRLADIEREYFDYQPQVEKSFIESVRGSFLSVSGFLRYFLSIAYQAFKSSRMTLMTISMVGLFVAGVSIKDVDFLNWFQILAIFMAIYYFHVFVIIVKQQRDKLKEDAQALLSSKVANLESSIYALDVSNDKSSAHISNEFALYKKMREQQAKAEKQQALDKKQEADNKISEVDAASSASDHAPQAKPAFTMLALKSLVSSELAMFSNAKKREIGEKEQEASVCLENAEMDREDKRNRLAENREVKQNQLNDLNNKLSYLRVYFNDDEPIEKIAEKIDGNLNDSNKNALPEVIAQQVIQSYIADHAQRLEKLRDTFNA